MSLGIFEPPRPLEPKPSESLLTETLTTSRHAFLQPTPELHTASVELAKLYLDPLAASLSAVQQHRLEESRRQRKRKRNEKEDYSTRDVLRLTQIHTEGFDIQQIWEQARRVIEASQREAGRAIRRSEETKARSKPSATNPPEKKVRFEDADPDEESDEELMSDEMESEDDEEDLEESLDELDDVDENEMDDSEEGSADEAVDGGTREQYVKDPHGLNDGFFSIDDFNRQSEFLEQQDARGDPDDGAASDEEEIDWTADLSMLSLSQSSRPSKRSPSNKVTLDEDGDGDNGPTFGNADLDAPWTDSEDDGDEDGLDLHMDSTNLSNTNEIHYADFFAPPPQPPSKKSKRRRPKAPPAAAAEPNIENDDEMEHTMHAARRDIFEDSASEDEEEDATKNLSSHERRQAALAAQIRQLEAQAVSEREWTMSGEARASDRPLNSLLEEDLEFERTGKPVPVATAEVSSSLEELIKRRILERQFDEVKKRVPGADLLEGSRARRGLVDIETRNPEHQSLSALYEAEHLQRTDPNYVAPRDAKLKAAHHEIERLWANVSAKLDALSNWNYRPKPPAVEVSVVTDAPRVAMEDARPTTALAMAEEGGLAPQEIYKAGAAKKRGEVVARSGAVSAKEELSREDKQRHHRREIERDRKKRANDPFLARRMAQQANAANGANGATDATQRPVGKRASLGEQKALERDLTLGGVKVIGKSGELVDVQGKKVKASAAAQGANSYKL